MKKQVLFNAAAAAMLVTMATACSNDYSGPDYEGSRLKVTGQISPLSSRVSNTTWDDGDAIGIHSADLSTNVNVKYNASVDGTFTPASTKIYILGSEEVEFFAYYPYNAGVTSSNPVISFDAAAGDNVDFMWASAKASRDNAQVNFLFTHKMTKLNFMITDTTIPDGTTVTVTLADVPTKGEFDTTDGSVKGTGTGTITVEGQLGANLSFILVPSENTNTNSYNLTINVDGKTFLGSFTPGMQPSTQNQYNINLSDTDERNYVTVSSGTITDWTQGDEGTIIVEEVEAPHETAIGDYLMLDGSILAQNKLSAENKAQVAGVIYYLGNPTAVALGYTSDETLDILANEAPSAVNGLAIAIDNVSTTPARLFTARQAYSTLYDDNNYLAENYLKDNLNLTSRGTKMLGYNNTRLIERYLEEAADGETAIGSEDLVNKLTTYRDAHTVANASLWYVPSFAEFTAVLDNYDKIAAAIVAAGGELTQFTEYDADGDDKIDSENFYWTVDLRGNSYAWVNPLCEVPDETFALFVGHNSNGTKGFLRLSIAF